MYDFAGESSDELSFARGEVIRVIDAVSDEWWRGELRGRTGIFPTNYVVSFSISISTFSVLFRRSCFATLQEPASAPSTVSSEAPRSAAGPSAEDMEGEVFSQAAAIDRLLSLMHTLRARGEDFADNEELTVSKVSASAPSFCRRLTQAFDRICTTRAWRYDRKWCSSSGSTTRSRVSSLAKDAGMQPRKLTPAGDLAELRAMNDKVEQAKATFERNAALARQHQQQAHGESGETVLLSGETASFSHPPSCAQQRSISNSPRISSSRTATEHLRRSNGDKLPWTPTAGNSRLHPTPPLQGTHLPLPLPWRKLLRPPDSRYRTRLMLHAKKSSNASMSGSSSSTNGSWRSTTDKWRRFRHSSRRQPVLCKAVRFLLHRRLLPLQGTMGLRRT